MLRGLAIVSLVVSLTGTGSGQTSRPVRVGEDGIRASAAKTVMPKYPESSRKNRAQGVAIVELEYSGSGDVMEVRVVESPDVDIGEAVVEAVKQWKFRQSTIKGKPLNVWGKLTFYFSIDRRGKGIVKNPKHFSVRSDAPSGQEKH